MRMEIRDGGMSEQDYLFPLLYDADSQMADWWAIRSFAHLQQRIEALNWLSKHHVGAWITYVVMHDFLDVKVVQHLHRKKENRKTMQHRICEFFYKSGNSSNISTVPME